MALVLTTLGVYQIGGSLWAAETTTAELKSIEARLLPDEFGVWRRVEFNEVQREHNSVFGEFSKVFVYQHTVSGQTVQISVDYPFRRAWHELTACYRGIGWELVSRQVRHASSGTESWNYVEAHFNKPTGDLGLLSFSFVDSQGRSISPPRQQSVGKRHRTVAAPGTLFGRASLHSVASLDHFGCSGNRRPARGDPRVVSAKPAAV